MKIKCKTRWPLLLLVALTLTIALSACGGAAKADPQPMLADQTAVAAQAPAPALQEPEIKTLYIGFKLEDCTGVAPQKCMMVKENPDDDYQYFYHPIIGFDYEEGYAYEIVVSVEKVANPPADSSSLKYTLVKIVSKTPAPTEAANNGATESGNLEGVTWQAVSLRNAEGKMIDILADAPISLEFADGKAVGSAGCNRYFTAYEADGNTLAIDDKIGSTMMACPQPVMAQEQAYLKLLPQAVTFEISDGSLTLSDADGKTLLTFAAPAIATAPVAEAKLVGPVWQWQGVQMANDTETAVADPASYTIQFSEDGSVAVKADCKQTAGNFTDENGSLRIELGPTTLTICSDNSLSDEFLKELSFAGTYVFDDNGNLVINMQMDGGDMKFAPAEIVAAAVDENAAMQKLAGTYKVILPPAEKGGPMRVATLKLKEDGSLTLSILSLGAAETTSEGVWTVTAGKVRAKMQTAAGDSSDFVLDVSRNGDLKVEGKSLTLVSIDENTPLHKQLSIPVITKQRAYVSLDLDAGNPLDPFIVSVNGGGTLNAAALGGDCAGYVNSAPVARITWHGEADFATIFFFSDHDPSLIIQSPDGAFHCNEDANSALLDPSITIKKPKSGIYNIWVGGYYADELIPGVLVVTARPDVTVETFSLDGLIQRGPVTSWGQKIGEKPVRALLDSVQRSKKDIKKVKAGGKAQSAAVTATGDIPAFEFNIPGQTCNGFIGDKPDMTFDWSGAADAFSVYFEGDADSTLLVVEPSGAILCNDDASPDNANPLIVVHKPTPGRYAVFVGRVHPEKAIKGKLVITDAGNAQPETLPPQPAPDPALKINQQ